MQARCGRSLATFLALQALICLVLYLRTAMLEALTVILPWSTGAFALAFGLAHRASRVPHAVRQHGQSAVARGSPCGRMPTHSLRAAHKSLVPRGEPSPLGS